MTQFVDWDLAVATARTLGRAGPHIGLENATEVVHELRGHAAEAAQLVADHTGMTPLEPPPLRVVDRSGWASANVDGLRGVLDPIAHRMSGEAGAMTRIVGARVAGAQAGLVMGYLSGKVLGQYEIFGERAGQLLLVAPNIVEAERHLKVAPRDFRMWICLHEATHVAQFGAVSWLRPHFLAEIEAFSAVGVDAGNGVIDRGRRAVSVLADSVRDPDKGSSVVDLVTSPQQREIVDRLTALMTLLEGHADFIMDDIGPQVVSDVSQLRRRFDRRRVDGGALQRFVRRALGMDLKLKQYTQGKKFTAAVVEQVGLEAFNTVWEQPSHLPTLTEIDSPDAWIERVVRS